MFKHLTPEEFVNLLEGMELTSHRRSHLEVCARCKATWHSMESVRFGISTIDDDIPEPDWEAFRSGVRDGLLSRSVRRQAAVRRWTGWPIRPAAAWVFSMLIVVGITAGALVWRSEQDRGRAPATVTTSVAEQPLPFSGLEQEIDVWAQSMVFEDLIQLGAAEQATLREMIEAAREGTAYRQ